MINKILLTLRFEDAQRDTIISICYDLGLFDPLISVFANNQERPDYLSCLNPLMLQTKQEEKYREENVLKIFSVLELAADQLSEKI